MSSGGYCEALEAAGARVIDFEGFGSYQGSWWALVSYQGSVGWVHGSYGSCSGCDAFEAEFAGAYGDESTDRQERLAKFGEGYLSDMMTHAEAMKVASEGLEWDGEAKKMVDWLSLREGLTLEQAVHRCSDGG